MPIRQNLSGVEFDLVICPYGPPGLEIGERKIFGFGASIFDKSLIGLRDQSKISRNFPSNFLITCGGSDPFNIATLYLRSLNHFLVDIFDIKIVVGSHFPKRNFLDLECEASMSHHKIQFIDAPQSLTHSYLGVDVALVTGGLTRNEVLLLGIPAIVTDLNIEQEISTKLFESGGALLRAGTYHQDGEADLILSMQLNITSLLNSQALRERMSESARIMMPGGGSELILKEIEQICIRKNQH